MLIFLKPGRKGKVASNMPGTTSAARQERVKKTATRPTPPVLFTINEEDEQQRNGKRRKVKGPDGLQGKTQEKKVGISRPGKDHALSKSEPHLVLKVEERQRLARERREEQEKLMAARESLLLEKEKKARQHYAKHMEERRKKLEEQRIKEERRRAAVDEKRRQKLEEEKERHEAVVRRTMERGQKPKQRQNRWSWGGALQSNTSISSSDPDRRSISTMNLSKHIDPVISKRLSTSSATLLNSPDRGRRPQLSPWESNVVSRLLIPTHSYLARSKSTAALSGDAVIPICPRSASCSPISPLTPKTPTNKSSERFKIFLTTPESIARRKTTHFAGFSSGKKKEKQEDEKKTQLTPSSTLKRAILPRIPRTKSPAALPGGHQKASVTISSSTKPAPSPSITSKEVTTPQRPPSPGNVRPAKRESKKKIEEKQCDALKESTEAKDSVLIDEENFEERPPAQSPVTVETEQDPPALGSTPVAPSPTVSAKPFAGTNDPEEATRILAEKRRLAREQREREEQEKWEKEEEERKKREELTQRKAEERAKREEEARKQEEERKQKEEMERLEKERILRQQAEEKEEKEREEAERLQQQKEAADRIRLEREKHFQKEEQERSERKKRLEEIMKRTRRSEAGDKLPNVHRNGEIPKTENTAITLSSLPEEQDSGYLQGTIETPRNGESVTSSPRILTFQQETGGESTEKQPNENGLSSPNNNFEEIINLPVGTKSLKRDALNNEGNRMEDLPLNPVIAFEVDNLQMHKQQRSSEEPHGGTKIVFKTPGILSKQ